LRSLHANSYPQKLSTGTQKVWRTRQKHAQLIHILAGNLTRLLRWFRLKRAAEAVSARGRNRLMGRFYAIAALVSITSIPAAHSAPYSVDHLKLYAHSRILNYDQFHCFHKIITKESRWSYTARNGSHYGLGQMRSTWYRDLDPYRQIDATIKYITKRYQTPCKAWAFHERKNWF
jgi:hypothetical protein